MNKYGNHSNKELKEGHPDLQLILQVSIAISEVDFGISEVGRSLAKQLQYYNEGKSKIDGIKVKGKHNLTPPMAADIYAFVSGKANYDPENLSYLAGLISGVAKMLYMAGSAEHLIRWGGNWDMDGEILIDQSFDDRPHVELYKPKPEVRNQLIQRMETIDYSL